MRQVTFAVGLAVLCWWVPVHALTKCPPDSVRVGNICIDLYEESVWQIPPSDLSLVRKVVSGTVTLGDLNIRGVGQLGRAGANDCTPHYPESTLARLRHLGWRTMGTRSGTHPVHTEYQSVLVPIQPPGPRSPDLERLLLARAR